MDSSSNIFHALRDQYGRRRQSTASSPADHRSFPHQSSSISLASSISSHDSGGGGGGKLRASLGGRSLATNPYKVAGPAPRLGGHSGKKKQALALGRPAFSMPAFGYCGSRKQAAGTSSSRFAHGRCCNRNEEWDLSDLSTIIRAKTLKDDFQTNGPFLEYFGRGTAPLKVVSPEPPSLCAQDQEEDEKRPSNDKKAEERKRRHVAFNATSELVGTSQMDDPNLWYNASDLALFASEAADRASRIDRTMRYISGSEPSYNASTGLTSSPRALKEYLSSPEEVVGLEHLLPAQRGARENLRSHHARSLLRAQRRTRDPRSLAESLNGTSAMSSHMARERASYVNLME